MDQQECPWTHKLVLVYNLQNFSVQSSSWKNARKENKGGISKRTFHFILLNQLHCQHTSPENTSVRCQMMPHGLACKYPRNVFINFLGDYCCEQNFHQVKDRHGMLIFNLIMTWKSNNNDSCFGIKSALIAHICMCCKHEFALRKKISFDPWKLETF